MTVEDILDRFSKAHPFADTRAYNIYHAEAAAQINQLIQERERLAYKKGQESAIPTSRRRNNPNE